MRAPVIGNKRLRGRFATNAGIASSIDVLALLAQRIPQISVFRTKSISLEAIASYETPILTQTEPGSFINAVGLGNEGAEKFRFSLDFYHNRFPEDAFLIVNIQGGSVGEFAKVASKLFHYADGFEVNVSCPHVAGRGREVINLTGEIVKAVKIYSKPVLVKLPPTENTVKYALEAIAAGADGLTLFNAAGPIENLVLSHGSGGVSGRALKETGLRAVREIADTVKEAEKSLRRELIIILEGGISTAQDVKDYDEASNGLANFFGVGSATIGMDTETMIKYFAALDRDLREGTNNAEQFLIKDNIMEFSPYKIMGIDEITDDLRILYFDKGIEAGPGQFVFSWIPGLGERPFSIADNNPLTLAVRRVGKVTNAMFDLKGGDNLMIRGPYGKALPIPKEAKIYAVGGGTGMAVVNFVAKNNNHPVVCIGTANEKELLFRKNFENCHVAVDDSKPGKIINFLAAYFEKNIPETDSYFFVCGPEEMMNGCLAVAEKYFSPEKIFASIERYMGCGVGACSKCSCSGLRICVDGPAFSYETIKKHHLLGLPRDLSFYSV